MSSWWTNKLRGIFKVDKKVEEKLENVLKELEKEGFKVREISDVRQHINFLGSSDLLFSRESYSIVFCKNGEIKFETTWSNQTITKEWIEKASRVLRILEGGF